MLGTLARMFLPRACVACGALAGEPGVLCRGCAAGLVVAPDDRCTIEGLEGVRCLLSYQGAGRSLVLGVKYHGRRAGARALGVAMAELVVPVSATVVTWAPTTADRRRARGFDQAQLLARAVARRLGLPCRGLLRRAPGPPQTGRSAEARQISPCFEPRRRVEGPVLLIDDVVTTGATMAAAGRALARGGASSVQALAAARTPRAARDGLLKVGSVAADAAGTDRAGPHGAAEHAGHRSPGPTVSRSAHHRR